MRSLAWVAEPEKVLIPIMALNTHGKSLGDSLHQVKLKENKVIFAIFLSYPGPTLQPRSAAPVSVSWPVMLRIRPWEAQDYLQL